MDVRPTDALAAHRDEVLAVLKAAGITNVRVIGSVLHGADRPGSDLDLLVQLPAGTGAFQLARVEAEVEAILGVPVDLVPDIEGSAALADARTEATAL